MKLKIGLTLLFLIFLAAAFGPSFSGYTSDEIQLAKQNLPPSSDHWFGTDDLGRDLFTRVLEGARISLFVGMAAAFIDLIIGVLFGSCSAFAGGKVDECMMRFADILYAIPYLLVVILFLVVIGPGLLSMLAALTIIGWITMARIVRGQILQLKKQEYILAAVALGASFRRILFKHLIPNATGPILVTLTLTIPAAIFSEAFLSFLGLGIQAPTASLGTMANEGLQAFAYYPWRLFVPAAVISITLFAFNLVGEGLHERWGGNHVPTS